MTTTTIDPVIAAVETAERAEADYQTALASPVPSTILINAANTRAFITEARASVEKIAAGIVPMPDPAVLASLMFIADTTITG